MALITRILPYTLAAACLCLVSMAGDAAVYKCVDPSGRVTYSERPCNGGEEVQIDAPCRSVDETAVDERLREAREYNEAVQRRLEVARIERELMRLESRRKALILERDKQVATLESKLKAAHTADKYFWLLRLQQAQDFYASKLAEIEKQILNAQLEAGGLREQQSRPKGRMLDLATQGDCRLFVEGEETSASFRIHGEGFTPGEVVEAITLNDGEAIRNVVTIGDDGCYEGIVVPRMGGKASGDVSNTVRGQSCDLTVHFKWRRP